MRSVRPLAKAIASISEPLPNFEATFFYLLFLKVEVLYEEKKTFNLFSFSRKGSKGSKEKSYQGEFN